MSETLDKTAIRDAATVIVVRDRTTTPSILMGQRGASAAFMPSKYVFPGGAVDAGDDNIALGADLSALDAERLSQDSTRAAPALATAAIRELWEETGQILGTPSVWDDAPVDWRGFAQRGHRPNASGLNFMFRAVTPQGNPRRFDARFFMVDADHLITDPDDFSEAEDELSHLHWVPLKDARMLDLPFITEVVLAELSAVLQNGAPPASVPFFRNDDEAHLVTRLGGRSPLDF
ncbi:NUDIX hydrolase [Octadecabacter ascidiaceicola]|uniref:NUDIX domain protein n=1 Tax=Octadecabacter ascidiaceicola TaxID=1655543 RepID=A0A238K2X8_9RHOB|nr:NUDIX hydrolase [Octadecabacter ascidiaceicola]SMX37268.1 NUDIX domain protein [Octadecabacter ascidiaceicola]